ncbi:MAG: DNA polymerase III subunit delta', partial [Rhodoferax sp.]
QTVDALQKLCHDLMAQRVGASPRFFDLDPVRPAPSLRDLSLWSQALSKAQKTIDHPFNAGLMQEALVAQAKNALNSHD